MAVHRTHLIRLAVAFNAGTRRFTEGAVERRGELSGVGHYCRIGKTGGIQRPADSPTCPSMAAEAHVPVAAAAAITGPRLPRGWPARRIVIHTAPRQ